MRIALFGGSFNPPHLGHLLCVAYAYAIAEIDQVWIMPAANHPYGKELLAWEHRWQLCQAAFAGLEYVHIRDDELRNDRGRTIDLLQQLQTQHPNNEWCFIGGTDTKADMPNWYCGQELLQQLHVIEIPRQGYDHESAAALPAISSSTVRERIAKGENIHDIVPAAVATLIEQHQWYA